VGHAPRVTKRVNNLCKVQLGVGVSLASRAVFRKCKAVNRIEKYYTIVIYALFV
jgi:hypothetical protein